MSLCLTLLDAGYCSHPEHVILQNGKWSSLRVPAMFGLIEHPQHGPMLFDTGYSQDFFRATRQFPYRLYAHVTPVHVREEDTAVAKLEARGIRPSDVRYVFISHFHGDHIAALRDFPAARYVHFGAAYEAIRRLRGFRALFAAFLPDLLPPDFDARSMPLYPSAGAPLPPECAPFERGVDVFGDGSVLAVELPGHAVGQLGLFLQTASGERFFLVADACYASVHYRELSLPHPITRLIMPSFTEYRDTIGRLHALHRRSPGVHIVPSHCREAYARHVRDRNPGLEARAPQAASARAQGRSSVIAS